MVVLPFVILSDRIVPLLHSERATGAQRSAKSDRIWKNQGVELSSALMGLRHFLAPKWAKNLSEQGKEVDDEKMPETLVNTRFMLIRAKTFSLSRFEAIF